MACSDPTEPAEVGSASGQESRSPGFPGGITSLNAQEAKVAGWIQAVGVGDDGQGSVDLEFVAALCP